MWPPQTYADLERVQKQPSECELDTPIIETCLRNRTKGVLLNGLGIRTVNGLSAANSVMLLRTKNCGRVTMRDIWLFLSEFLALDR
jgi:hypothetical protein